MPLLFLIIPLFFYISSCSNSAMNPNSNNGTVATSTTSTTSTTETLTIQSATESPDTSGNTLINLNVNSTLLGTDATTLCTITSGINACQCSFAWTETITALNSAQIQRAIITPVGAVQANTVTCNAYSIVNGSTVIYDNEIHTGQSIHVSIIDAQYNLLSSNTFTYQKTQASGNATEGSGTDSQGNPYTDIVRYGCYWNYPRTPLISYSQTYTSQTAAGVSTSYPYYSGSFFAANPTTVTSQQYGYFNLYRKIYNTTYTNTSGSFTCPTVNNKSSPLDSQFSLFNAPNNTFVIPVNGFVQLENTTDTTSQTCGSGQDSQFTNVGCLMGCLGYAAPVNSDGFSCPTFTNSNNLSIQTYRLRRFVGMMPKTYDGSGFALTPEFIDMIYTLDRPSPNSGMTMYGPKPCPFAYYASTTNQISTIPPATGSPTVYKSYATSNAGRWIVPTTKLSTQNFDQLTFPFGDTLNKSLTPCCSASIPILSIATPITFIIPPFGGTTATNTLTAVPVRPALPFWIHYEEDLNFKACAPPTVNASLVITGKTSFNNSGILLIGDQSTAPNPSPSPPACFTSTVSNASHSSSAYCVVTVPCNPFSTPGTSNITNLPSFPSALTDYTNSYAAGNTGFGILDDMAYHCTYIDALGNHYDPATTHGNDTCF